MSHKPHYSIRPNHAAAGAKQALPHNIMKKSQQNSTTTFLMVAAYHSHVTADYRDYHENYKKTRQVKQNSSCMGNSQYATLPPTEQKR